MKTQNAERVLLIGLPGAGKTTTGRALAEWLRWAFLDLDDLIVARAGKSVAAIFAQEGEPHFRALEADALAEACARDHVVIATGGGVGENAANLSLMRGAGFTVCLDAEPATALARLSSEARTDDTALADARPLLGGSDPLARLTELRARRQSWYHTADITIDANVAQPDAIAQRIAATLAGTGRSPLEGAAAVSRSVTTSSGAYESIVEWGGIAALGACLKRLDAPQRIHIVTDSTVAPLYQASTEQLLAQEGFAPETCIVPEGETSKTLDQWRAVLDWLATRRAERSEFLLALGGGVVGDLAGFAAATWLRGIPLIHVPTSLLAQVDSSIGGKVGVDLPQGKNLVGAFYPPRLVLADPALLLTLPRRQFAEGWSEAIKLGVTLNAGYFDFLEAHADALLRLEAAPACEAIARAVAIKAAVVEQDEGERGERALLNYGHTLGHAIEQVTGYARWLHGEAVAIGMAFAARLGRRIGVTPAELVARQDGLLTRMGLPTRINGLSPEALMDAMTRDKKTRDGALRWVIPTALGASALMTISREEVRAALLVFSGLSTPATHVLSTGAADAKYS